MTAPGWYPDPAGLPNRLRYWDGRSWTTQVSEQHPNPGGAGTPPQPGSTPEGPRARGGLGWLWALLVGVLVVLLVVALVVFNPFKSSDLAGPVPTYSPTISAWNESDSPTPTPSVPSPSITRLRCDQEGPGRTVQVNQAGSRLQVGAMSMPAVSGWEGPVEMNAVLYLKNAYGYTLTVEPRWFNQMVIGPTSFETATPLETQARTIVACLAGTTVMGRYRAPQTLNLKKVTVSGHAGVQADALYTWTDTDITSKGSLIRVVVVDTADGPYAFFGEATKERPDVIALMDTLTANLAIS